jgi:hypothetical protein
MARKRIKLQHLLVYDNRKGTSLVREVEMLVDAATNHDAYGVQFWRDVQLYSFHEAMMYLERFLDEHDRKRGNEDFHKLVKWITEIESLFSETCMYCSGSKKLGPSERPCTYCS